MWPWIRRFHAAHSIDDVAGFAATARALIQILSGARHYGTSRLKKNRATNDNV
jgi:hypothetical protein